MLFFAFSLVVGLSILIFSADVFVRGAVSLSSRWKVSPALVGVTVVAVGTSSPELMTSAIAALKGSSDIAFANVIGSNLFNILVVLGLAAMILPVTVTSRLLRIELSLCIVFGFFLGLAAWNFNVGRIESGILLIIYGLFVWISLFYKEVSWSEIEDVAPPLPSSFREWSLLFWGGLGLMIGAYLALQGALGIGEFLGLSERVIGVIIVSFGTSLPEMATSAVAAFRGRSDIAVANVLGSNIFNSLVIVGVSGLLRPMTISESLLKVDIPWMLAATFLLFPIIYFSGMRIGRIGGFCLLAFFLGYLMILF